MTWGPWLKELREQAGYTQVEMAERLGVSAATVSNWENEKFTPPISAINQLTALLPVSAEVLLRRLGVTLSAPSAAKLPAQLVSKLLAMPPAQLAALTEFLPGEPGSGNRAGQG